MDFGRAAETIEGAIASGAFPGAVVLVGRGDESLWHEAFGARSLEPSRTPMTRDIVFDLSSLTKPLATTTAVMLLVREGKLRLDDRVTRFIPNFGVHGKTHVEIRHLLAHCSGLPAWRPFYKDVQRAERQGKLGLSGRQGVRTLVFEAIHRERPESVPGSRAVYSDLGFILAGELIELVTHATLDRFCQDRIFRPLGLRATAFVDLDRLRRQKLSPVTDVIAPTERCPWRQKVLCGEVHDDNAWALGGVAGHAGLFATAEDVHRLVARLAACAAGADDFLPAALVRAFWTREGSASESTWALGWDMPSPEGSAAGDRIARNAVGHLGFTGTSVWLDRERGVHVVLLTNRVHPTRANERIRQARPRIHDAIFESLEGSEG